MNRTTDPGSLIAEDTTCTGERVDWTDASMHPMTVSRFVLVVRGIAPVPTDVCFHPLPIGVVADDYNGIEVLGTPKDPITEVETPWQIDLPDAERYNGTVGFVLIGATKREYFPPK